MRRHRPTPPSRLPLKQRLEQLAANARRFLPLYYFAAQLGAPCCAVASGAAVYWLIGLARYVLMYGWELTPGEWFWLSLNTVITCWLSWYGLHCLLVTFSVHRYFRREYDYAARLLLAEGLGPVLAQEEYWRPLYGWRRGLAGTPKFPEMSRTLEGHIAFAACFMESLRDLSRGPGRLRRYYILQGYSRHQVDIGMRQPLMLLLLPLAMGLTAAFMLLQDNGFTSLTTTHVGFYTVPIWPVALATALANWLLTGALFGPLALLMRARTAALCDFLLGRLDDSAGDYAMPPDEEGWWLRRVFVNAMGRVRGRA